MTIRNRTWQRRCYNIAEVREQAKRALPRPVFDFIEGGAEDEWTLQHNEMDFEKIALLPRPLNAPGTPDLSVELLGHRLSFSCYFNCHSSWRP